MKIQISIDAEADEICKLLRQPDFKLMQPSKPTNEYTIKELDARIWNWKMLRDSKLANQLYTQNAKPKLNRNKSKAAS